MIEIAKIRNKPKTDSAFEDFFDFWSIELPKLPRMRTAVFLNREKTLTLKRTPLVANSS